MYGVLDMLTQSLFSLDGCIIKCREHRIISHLLQNQDHLISQISAISRGQFRRLQTFCQVVGYSKD